VTVVLRNILRSGRCSSVGRGGLGGGFPYLNGIGLSGKRMLLPNERLDTVGEFGIDMLACIDGSGSLIIGKSAANELYDS